MEPSDAVTQEWLNISRDVDLRLRACLRIQFFERLVVAVTQTRLGYDTPLLLRNLLTTPVQKSPYRYKQIMCIYDNISHSLRWLSRLFFKVLFCNFALIFHLESFPQVKPYFVIPVCWRMTLLLWVIGRCFCNSKRKAQLRIPEERIWKSQKKKKNHRRPYTTRKFSAFHDGWYANKIFLGYDTVWDKFVRTFRSNVLSPSSSWLN